MVKVCFKALDEWDNLGETNTCKTNAMTWDQCDQIGQIFALWETF